MEKGFWAWPMLHCGQLAQLGPTRPTRAIPPRARAWPRHRPRHQCRPPRPGFRPCRGLLLSLTILPPHVCPDSAAAFAVTPGFPLPIKHVRGRGKFPPPPFSLYHSAPLCPYTATVVRRQAVIDLQPSRVPESSSTGAPTASQADSCSELPGPPDAFFFTAGSHRCRLSPTVPRPRPPIHEHHRVLEPLYDHFISNIRCFSCRSPVHPLHSRHNIADCSIHVSNPPPTPQIAAPPHRHPPRLLPPLPCGTGSLESGHHQRHWTPLPCL
jgi:hypothetical protein